MTTKQGIPVWQVDAFADGPFTGNPAAVCILTEYPSDDWMQNVATEMNLAETAFVVPSGDRGSFHLRWFTPAAEVDLCGHATLAASHTLMEQCSVARDAAIRFQTRSGQLICEQRGNQITLDFPSTPVIASVADSVATEVRLALGMEAATVMRSKFDVVAIVDSADAVRCVEPDFQRLQQIETRGVMITAKTGETDTDFISRFFAPRHGINEDPVTGSAHCCLAPYWAEQLGTTKLVGYQASRRGGTVHCEVSGDRVKLSGTAVTVLEGWLLMVPQ
jgi:PhzF family phenazine biosynthesis protein